MKTTILQENLNKGLSLINQIISPKINLPILNNVLISCQEEGKLKLTATNLETGVNIWLPAKLETKGDFTLPAKDLLEFISSLPPEKITLEQEKEKIKVISGEYKAVFNGMSAIDYPQVPSLKTKTKLKIKEEFTLPVKKFIQAVSKVIFAAAIDETRPVLTGIRMSSENKTIQLVATDGYRLSLKKLKIDKKISLPDLIIPAKALQEIVKIIEASKEEKEKEEIKAAIIQNGNQVIFSFKNTEVVTRLIEGDFPDFEKIIPAKGDNKAIIDKQEFLTAIKATSIFARRSANIIKLSFKEGQLMITANAPELGKNEVSLGIKYNGDEVNIAFNFRFLQDFLNSLKTETFMIELSDSLKPGLFKPEKSASYLHIIMPVRLQK